MRSPPHRKSGGRATCGGEQESESARKKVPGRPGSSRSWPRVPGGPFAPRQRPLAPTRPTARPVFVWGLGLDGWSVGAAQQRVWGKQQDLVWSWWTRIWIQDLDPTATLNPPLPPLALI